MKRRSVLITLGVAGSAVLGGGSWWLNGPRPAVQGFADWTAVRTWLHSLTSTTPAAPSGWLPAQTLQHLAQSIDFSLVGYPELKPAWFRHTAGALAGRIFQRRGVMQHDLAAPIPGAALLSENDLGIARTGLLGAIDRFEAHRGPLAPHFAYGELDYLSYQRAHLMHVAEHAATLG